MRGRDAVERDRALLDGLADKWSLRVLDALCASPMRFNELRRELEPVTAKALTHTLRRLEAGGIVEREVVASRPVAVEYRITDAGRSLEQPLQALLAQLRQ